MPRDGALVATGGHLHPGGLWTDLTLTRDGRSTRLFRSRARYYEPAGAVSWDVSMTVTPPQWRVQLRAGDVLSVSGTYNTRRASWYESMAIMPTMFDPGGTGADPFAVDVDVEGDVTHGHLPENDNHGGGRFSGLADPRALLSRPVTRRKVAIQGFVYGQGDLSAVGRAGRPARVREGKRLTFVNRDARETIFHTITACKAPCNRTTGIAYPLADGDVDFDSGELGFGPRGFTAAANRDTWKTPKGLRRRHLHVLLPRAPLHARRLRGQGAPLTPAATAAGRAWRPRRRGRSPSRCGPRSRRRRTPRCRTRSRCGRRRS